MGLAVLPARLKKEMAAVGQELVKGTEDISGMPEIASHADWYKMLRKKYPNVTEDQVAGILKQEIGKVFETVLTHAGVYKRNPQGMEAFDRFVAHVDEE